jgi:hypothetical protein
MLLLSCLLFTSEIWYVWFGYNCDGKCFSALQLQQKGKCTFFRGLEISQGPLLMCTVQL